MALATLMARIRLQGAQETQRDLTRLKLGFQQAGDAAKSMGHHASGAVKDLARNLLDAASKATLLGGAVGGAFAFDAAVKMDSLTRALASTSTSADDLRQQLTRLKEVAKLPGLGFEEAVQGSVKLQSAGLSAQLAERSLKAFGNALALVGGGKDQLDGVITALSQIVSKGEVSAEEINQLAERVPQIRQLLAQAFGTSDTQKIQAMGVSAAESIERIVTAAEKLPRATGGFQNALENFSDGIKTAIEPLGQGFGEAFVAAQGSLQKFISVLQRRMNQIGETFAALGKSGVLGEVIERLVGAFDGLLGSNLQERLAGFFANVASFVVNLPQTFKDVGKFLSDLFQAIGKNMVTAFRMAELAVGGVIGRIAAGIAGITEALTKMLAFDPKGALSALQGIGTASNARDAIAGTLSKDLKFAPLPAFNARSPLGDADRFKKAIMASLGPLSGIPDDLIFGGKKPGTATAGSDLEDPIERLLLAIERNTKQAAEALSLRAQTLGGGELAGLGVTPAELRGAGVSGFAPSGFDYLPRVPSSQVERAQRQMMREEIRRAQGKGRLQ